MTFTQKVLNALLKTAAMVWLLFSIAFSLRIVMLNLGELGDFGSFIAAGQAVQNGTNPYDNSSPLIFETLFPRFDVGGKMPNLNPPISLLAFEPLANSNFTRAVNIWRITSLLIYLTTVLLLAYEYRSSFLQILWSLSLAGLWHTIGLGQIYVLLVFLTSLAWIASRRGKDTWAGVFLGLLFSIKPNFVLWLLLLAIQRKWKTVLPALITMVVCAVLPLLRVGPEVYLQWLDATRVDSRVLSMPGNSSFMGLTSRMGFPLGGIVLTLVLLAVTLLVIVRARAASSQHEWTDAAGIFLSLLASPITWAGYTILIIPYFLFQKRWNVAVVVAAAILTLPFNFVMHFYYNFGRFTFIFWGWWYGIALTVCMAHIIVNLWSGFGSPRSALLQIPQ